MACLEEATFRFGTSSERPREGSDHRRESHPVRVFVCDKSSRATTLLAQCRTNLPSRTHDITTPAWRLVIYHPAANLHYV